MKTKAEFMKIMWEKMCRIHFSTDIQKRFSAINTTRYGKTCTSFINFWTDFFENNQRKQEKVFFEGIDERTKEELEVIKKMLLSEYISTSEDEDVRLYWQFLDNRIKNSRLIDITSELIEKEKKIIDEVLNNPYVTVELYHKILTVWFLYPELVYDQDEIAKSVQTAKK